MVRRQLALMLRIGEEAREKDPGAKRIGSGVQTERRVRGGGKGDANGARKAKTVVDGPRVVTEVNPLHACARGLLMSVLTTATLIPAAAFYGGESARALWAPSFRCGVWLSDLDFCMRRQSTFGKP